MSEMLSFQFRLNFGDIGEWGWGNENVGECLDWRDQDETLLEE